MERGRMRKMTRSAIAAVKVKVRVSGAARVRGRGARMTAGAATQMALAMVLTMASGWKNNETDLKIGMVAGDVTQAFVHADMDEKVITRVPKELDGLEILIDGATTILPEGVWLDVLKALYKYRKSPNCGRCISSRHCKD